MNGFPDRVVVKIIVLMPENVSQSPYIPPVHLWAKRSGTLAEPESSFSKNLKLSFHG